MGKTYGTPTSSGGSTSWFNNSFKPPASNRTGGRSKGSSATSAAARASGKTSWQRPGGPAPRYDAEFRAAIANDPSMAYNQTAYNSFAHDMALGLNGLGLGSAPSIGGGYSGGGYGRGGGGGGGGPAMTQAMFDLMVKALGQQAPQFTPQQVNLPAFQGQNIAAFNATPYTQAAQSLQQAVTADRAAVAQNAANTTRALSANYQNDYRTQAVTPGANFAPAGAALQGTAGAPVANDANQQAANQANAANTDSQAAFSNLLNVLAANADQSQASRMNQVALDQQTANNAIGAQNLGLGAQINQARAAAQNQWQQQDNERRYQNSLMAQQWQREAMTRSQDLTNQGRQLNYQTQIQQMQSRLQPILDLISSTAGTKIDTKTLLALLTGRPAA